ncbi:391_t:CDS:2 [Rhizophagus irregularis]|nr:391_t:CDS:2 [Rhizophagus irregularis]
MDFPSRLGCIEIEKWDEQQPENKMTERAYRLDKKGKEMTDNEFIIKDSWRPISRQIVKYYHHEDVTLKDGDNQDKAVDDTFVCIRKQLHLPLNHISRQTFQLREPEYRRLITSTCGKLIYRFNDQDSQCHRTGTLPFMAIEILKHNAEHTFQHDLESFFYVLCWICCEYEGSRGKLRASDCGRKNLMKWVEGSPETIGTIKSGMILDFERDILETPSIL